MARVTWSDQALRRLNVITLYMDLEAPAQTDVVLAAITSAGARLKDFPRLGRRLAARPAELRQLISDNYRLVYQVAGDDVTIMTVLHTSMDVEARLQELMGDY